MGEGTDSVLSAMRQEYKERGIDWAPIRSGLLKEKPTSMADIEGSVDTVAYNFNVIDAQIGGMSYF